MNGTPSDSTSALGKTRIVEIIGPAGAGKTTLYQALGCHTDRIRRENIPDVHKLMDAPFYILNGVRLISKLLRLPKSNSRKLTRREFAWMSILYGWSALLHKQSTESNKVIVLDQGPIFLMAEMRLFGPEYLRQKTAEGLWQDLCASWSSTLHMVVWLDAADDILLARIRNRRQEHIMKAERAEEVYEFLDRYRAEFKSTLSHLRSQQVDFKVLTFDTVRQQTQNIVNQLLAELSCESGK